jgi:hypothetical protein
VANDPDLPVDDSGVAAAAKGDRFLSLHQVNRAKRVSAPRESHGQIDVRVAPRPASASLIATSPGVFRAPASTGASRAIIVSGRCSPGNSPTTSMQDWTVPWDGTDLLEVQGPEKTDNRLAGCPPVRNSHSKNRLGSDHVTRNGARQVPRQQQVHVAHGFDLILER